MKNTILLIILLPIYLAAGPFDGKSDCEPLFIRLSFSSERADTAMGITWNTKEKCDAIAMVGELSDLEFMYYGTSSAGPDGTGWINEVTVTGLKHSTKYNYIVGNGTIYSPVNTFITAPLKGACDRFSFTVASDSRADQEEDSVTQKWANIMSESLLDPETAFIINGGDLVYDGALAYQWVKWLEVTPSIISNKPFMAALGNHDDGPVDGDGAHYNKIFNFPKNPVTNTEDSYYFIYGNALFVVLSTSSFKDKFADLALWMDSVFEEHKDVAWKIVFLHHPIYCSAGTGIVSSVGHEPNEVGQNLHFVPVFDKHKVDLVVGAHNHYYERFSPSFGSKDNKYPIPVNDPSLGTVYVLSGGGGATTIPDQLTNLMCTSAFVDGSKSCSGLMHYLKIRIDSNVLTMETWATSQQTLSNNPSNRELIDQYTITKQSVECATEEPDDTEVSDESIEPADENNEIPDEKVIETPDETADTPDENNTVPDESTSQVPDNSDTGQTEEISSERSGCSVISL
ncbi:MAG TPA: metallophosphoesterase family protein [bacterium]|nr:metallophosphoesterase family protein [bacterium]